MLGLDPEQVVARIQAEGRPFVLPTLRQSLTTGTVGFMIVGVTAFSLWAFAARPLTQALGQAGFYAVIAFVLFGGGALVLKPLLIGRNLGRFAVVFALGFALLSAAWIIGDATRLPHRVGEFGGVLIGSGLLALALVAGWRAWPQALKCVVILTAGHVGGYLLADRLFALEALHNQFGMLIWGLVYGAGLGLGVSGALYHCQTSVRDRLAALVCEASARPEEH